MMLARTPVKHIWMVMAYMDGYGCIWAMSTISMHCLAFAWIFVRSPASFLCLLGSLCVDDAGVIHPMCLEAPLAVAVVELGE